MRYLKPFITPLLLILACLFTAPMTHAGEKEDRAEINKLITVKNWKDLEKTLGGNTTLTTLNLGMNQIGAEGAKAIGSALEKNTTLTTLNLWENNIGFEGAKAIGSALEKNTTLTTLDLRCNRIGAEMRKTLIAITKSKPGFILSL